MFGVVHAGPESPRGELSDVDFQFFSQFRDFFDVFAFVRPDLDRRIYRQPRGGNSPPGSVRQFHGPTGRRIHIARRVRRRAG